MQLQLNNVLAINGLIDSIEKLKAIVTLTSGKKNTNIALSIFKAKNEEVEIEFHFGESKSNRLVDSFEIK